MAGRSFATKRPVNYAAEKRKRLSPSADQLTGSASTIPCASSQRPRDLAVKERALIMFAAAGESIERRRLQTKFDSILVNEVQRRKRSLESLEREVR